MGHALPLAVALFALTACEQAPTVDRMPGGNAEAGRRAISLYGCGSCHVIPGIPGARGVVGPPLTDFGRRVYIVGSLPNMPDNLVRWLRDPPAIEPNTAMPDLGVSQREARDIAAYLYTLR